MNYLLKNIYTNLNRNFLAKNLFLLVDCSCTFIPILYAAQKFNKGKLLNSVEVKTKLLPKDIKFLKYCKK